MSFNIINPVAQQAPFSRNVIPAASKMPLLKPAPLPAAALTGSSNHPIKQVMY